MRNNEYPIFAKHAFYLYTISMATYDTIIKSGMVYDGRGSDPVQTDIGITGDRIAAIGPLKETAATTIDATGKYVTPGFIDITNHSDTHLTIFKYPGLESMLLQGITTAIGGNCGASLAPLGSPDALKSISKWADLSEININWATFEEYLGELDRLRPGINFGSFAGYGSLRRGVIGSTVRALTQGEREKVKFLLANALDQGAFGLSLGLSYGHEAIASIEELIEIAHVVRAKGGILKIHLRSEGKGLLAAVNEVVRIGRETGAPIQISHLKAIGGKSWHMLTPALDIIHHARESGLDINFDISPYAATGSSLYLLIPAWAREGGFTELFKRIDDPAERKKIIDTLKTYTLHANKILITSSPIKNIVGKTLEEVAENGGITTEEALLALVRTSQGRVSIIGRTLSIRNTKKEIADPNSFIASDSAGYADTASESGDLIHPRSFGAFAHFWHRFVHERALITPQEAIKKITSAPAEKLNLRHRGVLVKDYIADIAIFDPKLFRERNTYRDPYKYAIGMDWVLINGNPAVAQGAIAHARYGKIVKKS
mgnify:CR=1 FL=1